MSMVPSEGPFGKLLILILFSPARTRTRASVRFWFEALLLLWIPVIENGEEVFFVIQSIAQTMK